MYVCMHACMYVCMYVCIYIYTYMHSYVLYIHIVVGMINVDSQGSWIWRESPP